MKLDPKIEKRIDELLGVMSLTEKVGQLNQISTPRVDDEKVYEMLRQGRIGSFIMSNTAHAGNEMEETPDGAILHEVQRVAVEQGPHGIPVIYGRDVIHGHKTVYPVPLAMSAAFEPELVKKCYRNIAKEAARDFVHWTFTPMLDISRDPRWGRCVESPGEDPYLGRVMARAVVEGFQGEEIGAEGSVAACAKHYICYGAAEGGRDYHKAEVSDYTLRNYYLPAFREAIDAGVQTVMSSFNEISGNAVTSSHYLLTELLRDELGFDGFVVSDWEAVCQLEKQGLAKDRAECTEMALCAGLDMDMVDCCYMEHLERLVEEGVVPMSVVDEACRRVLRVKLRMGLFEHPYAPKYLIDYDAHRRDARELAAKSMVLLKNEKNALPLRRDESLVLIGPMVDEKGSMLGSWSLDGDEADVVSIREGLQAASEGDVIRFNYSHLLDEQYRQLRYAQTAVMCLGESRWVTGEYSCLANTDIPAEQVEMVYRAWREGKKVIAVLCFGRPVAIEKILPYCDAVLYAWHPGVEAGNAIADVLYGDVNPGGKLPMTMLRSTGQIPLYYNAPSSGRPVNGYYGEGDSYFDMLSSPLYPFGFGLSYTSFSLSQAKIDCERLSLSELKDGKKLKLHAVLTNTGARKGSETVQLYVRDPIASMMRPLRELKGFEKVMLAPGESREVSLEIGYDELAFYNGKGEYVVEAGEFYAWLGTDAFTENGVSFVVEND